VYLLAFVGSSEGKLCASIKCKNANGMQTT
jgi:hypothetical protein